MQIKFVQNIIDIFRGKNTERTIRYFELCRIHKKLDAKMKILAKQNRKIKVAFLHMYATDCQDIYIFDKMLNDNSIFDPYFIINPDVSRSRKNFEFNYNRSKKELTEKYGTSRVLDGYDFKNNKYVDFTSEFDIAFTNNPYDSMAHKCFQIEYWTRNNTPIFYISYFYMGRCNVSIDNLKSEEFGYIYKYFAENDYVKKLAKKYSRYKGKNFLVTGYPKIDKLYYVEKQERKRKKIIIAPHHTINSQKTSVGGFLEYSDILLKFPVKYPEIDFVFRPHPLLFENIKNEKIWTSSQVEDYINNLLKNNNVTYDKSGSYFDLFVNSDGLIHDCGSFMAEYLSTGHPAAYYLKSTLDVNATWTDFGKECAKNHYIIKDENNFYDFIENVVIKGNDTKKEEREAFAKNNIMINYPNSANVILKNIL